MNLTWLFVKKCENAPKEGDMKSTKYILFGTLASLAITSFAFAGENDVKVEFSKKAADKFHDDYGDREIKIIIDEIESSINQALKGKDYKVEVLVNDISPSRPTFDQMSDRPELSYQSISIGGADLEGKVFDIDGDLLLEVEYEYTAPSLELALLNWTWDDASFAIDQFSYRLKKDLKNKLSKPDKAGD